jgi:hypothetical protein
LIKKVADFIDSKGLDIIKDHNISKNFDKNEILFENLFENYKDRKNKKEDSEFFQIFNNPENKFKRTFEINLIPNKLEIENLRLKFKLNYRLIPIFWSNKIIHQNMDNNFPDIYNNVFLKIKEVCKKNYIQEIKEGIFRYENLDKSMSISIVNIIYNELNCYNFN